MCISSAMLRCFSEFHVTFVTMSGDVSQNSLVGDASQKSASPAWRVTISTATNRLDACTVLVYIIVPCPEPGGTDLEYAWKTDL